MRVLITGGSGTFGHYIIRDLIAAGHSVIDFSLERPLVEEARWIEGDVTAPERIREACRGQDAVIHLAGIAGPGRARPERLLSVNVVGTVNVLEAAVEAEVRKFVLASSQAAFGFGFQTKDLTPRYFPIDEDHPAEPQDPYGLSKLLGELTAKRYSDAFGMQTICLRLCNCWYLDREGAELTVRSGWAKGWTVEQLWDSRYRKMIEDAEGDWPTPGPPAPWKCLWVATDARDAARACRLAVENDSAKQEVLIINGSDTCSLVETRLLIARYYPRVPVRRPLENYASLFSNDRAAQVLGYRPRYSWRHSDYQTWREKSMPR